MIEFYSCSIFNGKSRAACHVVQDDRYTETMVSGPENYHAHMSVGLILCLGSWLFSLCCGEISVFSTWFRLRKFGRLGARFWEILSYQILWMKFQSKNINKVRILSWLLYSILEIILQVVFRIWFRIPVLY